jgi:hypothetical protein
MDGSGIGTGIAGAEGSIVSVGVLRGAWGTGPPVAAADEWDRWKCEGLA